MVWDFDLTLVDTRHRNLRVTRRIVETMTGRDPDELPALRSVEAYEPVLRRYRNWQDLYVERFGLDGGQLARAAELWTAFQSEDDTPPVTFAGLGSVLRALHHLPHGIVSLNARGHIERALHQADLLHFFELIVGYEEVDFHRQKPSPEGLLLCVERLTAFAPGAVFYVGDHESDVECAGLANSALSADGHGDVRIVSVAAAYGAADLTHWTLSADHVARGPEEILALARRYGEGGRDAAP